MNHSRLGYKYPHNFGGVKYVFDASFATGENHGATGWSTQKDWIRWIKPQM